LALVFVFSSAVTVQPSLVAVGWLVVGVMSAAVPVEEIENPPPTTDRLPVQDAVIVFGPLLLVLDVEVTLR
jgi:hypothetical protein